ncbi:MAG: AMP-binding protein [Planctomycetes bacterium]|nr:AMP-binding protein [Planctomycetota bacterium]
MLVEALLESAQRFGRSPAVADASRRWDYRRLATVATAMRSIIKRQATGQRVGIMLPACAAFPAVLFGALWAGKTAVPLNFLLSADELARIVKDAGLDVVYSVRHFRELLSKLPVRTAFLEDLPLKRGVVLAKLRPRPKPPGVSPNDTAVILYTSGTSGDPKGVELTYGNLRSNCDACIEAARMTQEQTFLNLLPPFHVFGLTGNVLVPVVLGANVFAIPRFQPGAALEAMRQERVSIVLAIPSMYSAMLRQKSAPADALASVDLAMSGGEPLPPDLAQGFAERFGVTLHQGYGLTETAPVISLCGSHMARDGSVGRIVPGVECRIVDDDHVPLATGGDGEIQVRGPCVMKGYYRRPDETAAVIDAQGWFRTGDVGRLDEDGFLFITGRKKEMIIVGGENVHPREIEGVLEQHPAVEEAAVIGMPDVSRGETPLAFVTFKADQSATEIEMRSFAKQRLAGFKVPREIRVIDDFPRGPTGKVLKRALRESFAAKQVST